MSKVIVIDTETTGLQAGVDEILQLSIIDGDGNTLYDKYFKPEHQTSWEEAEAVNGISPQDVADCPSFKSEIETINNIVKDSDIVVGYNTPFDVGFIEASGASMPDNAEYYDVMQEFAPIYGEWSDKYGCYKWQKLTVCAAYFGYDWSSTKAHNSLADCLATLYCFNKIKANGVETA